MIHLVMTAVMVAHAAPVDGYQSARWGMTRAEVGARIEEAPCVGFYPSSICAKIGDLLGNRGEAVYTFGEDGLERVRLAFPTARREWAAEVIVVLAEKYGPPPRNSATALTRLQWDCGVTLVYDEVGGSGYATITYSPPTAPTADEQHRRAAEAL